MSDTPPVLFDGRYTTPASVEKRVEEAVVFVVKRENHTGKQSEATIDLKGMFEVTASKNSVSGYAGLNASSRLTKGADVTDDVIVDTNTKGVVLKAATGEYVRLGVVVTLGVPTLSLTVLGGKP